MDRYELNEREKSILRYVIHQFILTANPVGSRNITKKYDIGLSPATVRNIMADLEESGYLNHPHTSAGRIPTDKGYRVYVDSLMGKPVLHRLDKKIIDSALEETSKEADNLLKITSTILSDITNQLACVTYPKFENATLEKIKIVELSSTRILVVLTIKSGMIKTITLELNSSISRDQIEKSERILNERLAGLKFAEIRSTINERVRDQLKETSKPIIRVFLDSVDKLFADVKIDDKSIIRGAKNILRQPEFGDHTHLGSVIELIENRDVIVHIMDNSSPAGDKVVSITIGEENIDDKFSDYSTITKEYSIGSVNGKVGIVGPKRMDYSKVIAAVVYVAEMLTNELKNQKL